MRVLGVISALELVVQFIGARKAIRVRIPYVLPFAHGEPEDVSRDMWNMGSGLSAPWQTLAVHAAGTVLLLARPRVWVARVMGCFGIVYVIGYLGERVVRDSFRHPNGETTAISVIGLSLVATMAVLGFTARR